MASSQRFHEAGWVFLGQVERRSREHGTNGVVVLAAGEVLYADVLQLPNGMSKVGVYK
jgi:hypothetical protein